MKLSQRLDRLESQLQPATALNFTAADIEQACLRLAAWLRDKSQAVGNDEGELAASVSAARRRLQQMALRLPTAAD